MSAGAPDDDPWGLDEPPAVDPARVAPLPPRLAELAALRGPRPAHDDDRWPDARELPEVQQLEGEGWQVLEPAPMLLCLPAFWPRHLRCWVPDRLPRVVREHRTSGTGRTVAAELRPATEDEVAVDDEHADHCARLAGLPPAPRRRLWLLRSPWPETFPLPWLLSALQDIAYAEAGGQPESDPLAAAASRVLADVSEDGARRILAEWEGDVADAAAQWRAEVDPPPQHVRLALVGVGPDVLLRVRTALAEIGLPEDDAVPLLLATGPHDALEWVPLLVEGLTSLAELSAEPFAVEVDHAAPLLRAGWTLGDARRLPDPRTGWDVAGWRVTGLTARCVGGLLRHRPSLRPDELDAWAAEGVGAEALVEVLHADPTTVPAEWVAFDRSGLPRDVALDWLAHGFAAAQAVAWEAAGVVPAEARVWRAQGLDEADVPQRTGTSGPVLPEGWWVAAGSGEDRRSRTWSVTDPPATRGRVASNARSDA